MQYNCGDSIQNNNPRPLLASSLVRARSFYYPYTILGFMEPQCDSYSDLQQGALLFLQLSFYGTSILNISLE